MVCQVNTHHVGKLCEIFYFSDTKKCALLNEKVMDFLVENETMALDWMSNKGQNVPQSETMLTGFLAALAKKKTIEMVMTLDSELCLSTL